MILQGSCHLTPNKGASPLSSKPNQLYLVDLSSLIFKSYHAIGPLKSPSGEPSSAVFGVARILWKLFTNQKPHYLALARDTKTPLQRKLKYPDYKINRSTPPDDLVPQFARIDELIQALVLPSLDAPGFEADDVIATLSSWWLDQHPEHEVIIVSNDKDLAQLIGPKVSLWDQSNNHFSREAEIIEKFGVRPDQIRDYLALVGDSSDNVPGVSGIGAKTAAQLLQSYGSLEGCLKAAQNGSIAGKKGQTLLEEKELALLSYDLVGLHEKLPLNISLEKLAYSFEKQANFKKIKNLFETLGFSSLITSWSLDSLEALKKSSSAPANLPLDLITQHTQADEHQPFQKPEFKLIQTASDLSHLIHSIETKGECGFDLETTSLNPRQAHIVGLSFCVSYEESFYIPLRHQEKQFEELAEEQTLKKLKPLLENPKIAKIGQNLKFDGSILLEHGIQLCGISGDTMVAAYVLNPESKYSLEYLASTFLNYKVTTFEEICGPKGKHQLTFDQVGLEKATQYAAEDAWVAYVLWKQKLEPRLQKLGLMKLYQDLDLPLIEVLTRIECCGVLVDLQIAQTLGEAFQKELETLEKRILEFSSQKINLNSPLQIQQFLFQELALPAQHKTKKKSGFSTDSSALEKLADLHEVPRLLLQYREFSKLKGTYIDPLPELVDPKTGRIHTSFHQTATATGRLSSSQPNLQNIPVKTERGHSIRKIFIAPSGSSFMSADYSQIELRVLAHMSEDPELIASFQKDEDIHQRTASEIFSVALNQVNNQQRTIAKAINFGLMYGKTAFGLAKELGISRKEAKELIEHYFGRYQRVKIFFQEQIARGEKDGFVTSLFGRRRNLPDLQSKNFSAKALAERMVLNTPIQSTAADLTKLAMIAIDQALMKGKLRSKLILQVHDEVVLECPDSELEKVQKMVAEKMEKAYELKVPLKANVSSGRDWSEL